MGGGEFTSCTKYSVRLATFFYFYLLQRSQLGKGGWGGDSRLGNGRSTGLDQT